MRFLILSQYYPPEIGAAQVRLGAMVDELKKQGHEVEVVTAMPNHPTGQVFPDYRRKFYLRECQDGVRIHRLWIYAATGTGIKRVLNYASFTTSSFIGLMKAQRPDYLFVESPPLFLGVPAIMWGAHKKVPVIFNVADLWPDSIKELGVMKDGIAMRWLESLEAWIYRKSSYVNAVTEGIKETLLTKKNVPQEKILFLPNGVDISIFRPREPDLALARQIGITNKKVLVYAGTMGVAHGLEVALSAMRILQDKMPEAHLVLIGGGTERASLELVAKKWSLSNVTFLQPEAPEYIARLYSLAFAGLSTLKDSPLFEGTRPSKIFPIMASAKPVIYSGAGEGARLIEEAKAGIVVPPEDPAALARAIVEISRKPELAEELGNNGRRYVEENLSWSRIVDSWLNQLQSEVNGAAR